MGYFPEGAPAPMPTRADSEWFKYASEKQLVIQKCAQCGALRHPPAAGCPKCQSFDYGWQEVSGKGRIYTWTITYYPISDYFKKVVPFNIIVVELDDAPGIRITSNLVYNEAANKLTERLPVEVVWDEQEGFVLPRFRIASVE